MRVVIVRPSAIIQCRNEPLPGWIDTVSAVGVVCFPYAMGFIKSIYLTNGPRDFVPGDYCSNAILTTAAYVRT